jgi:hypothetical protein
MGVEIDIKCAFVLQTVKRDDADVLLQYIHPLKSMSYPKIRALYLHRYLVSQHTHIIYVPIQYVSALVVLRSILALD